MPEIPPHPATFENAVAFAQDLIRIPSPSGQEEEVARRIREELEALAFDRVATDEWGNVVGVVPGVGADGKGPDAFPTVVLNSHTDVVNAGDPSQWEYPPYGGIVEDGHLHGRGAMDIKGPLALQVYAAAALRGSAPGDVVVALTVHEERGGLGLHRLLEAWLEGRYEPLTGRPDVVVLGEATQGDITIGHRGRAELEVVIHGRAGHASAPDRARNALDLVGPVLDAIRSHNRTIAARVDPVLGPATLVATGVDVVPETRNVIPDRAIVVVDWRVLPEDTPESVVAGLEEAIREELRKRASAEDGSGADGAAASGGDAPDTGIPAGLRLEVRVNLEEQSCFTGYSETRALFSPGFLMDADDPMVLAAAAAVGKEDDPDAPATIRPWTFATDGGWSCGVMGIPTIGFAPGLERHAHTNRERLSLDQAEWAFARYPDLVVAVQKALAEGP